MGRGEVGQRMGERRGNDSIDGTGINRALSLPEVASGTRGWMPSVESYNYGFLVEILDNDDTEPNITY